MALVGWTRVAVLAIAVGTACTSESDPGDVLRTSAVWTAVDDDLPELASEETSMPGSAEHGCVSLSEVHELEGPDERVLDELAGAAIDDGWEVLDRHPIAGSAAGSIDNEGPAAQMIVVRRMGDTTVHVALTVLQHPGYEGRWTLVTQGTCRDTDQVQDPHASVATSGG